MKNVELSNRTFFNQLFLHFGACRQLFGQWGKALLSACKDILCAARGGGEAL